MAQFRAVIKGQRGEASRLGSKKSGLTAVVNGWNSGIMVKASHCEGSDTFTIYRTNGSGESLLGAERIAIVYGDTVETFL